MNPAQKIGTALQSNPDFVFPNTATFTISPAVNGYVVNQNGSSQEKGYYNEVYAFQDLDDALIHIRSVLSVPKA